MNLNDILGVDGKRPACPPDQDPFDAWEYWK